MNKLDLIDENTVNKELYNSLQKTYLSRVGLSVPPEWNGMPDIRVDGRRICSVCGKQYNEHPFDTSCVFEDRYIFRLDCNGQRLKL